MITFILTILVLLAFAFSLGASLLFAKFVFVADRITDRSSHWGKISRAGGIAVIGSYVIVVIDLLIMLAIVDDSFVMFFKLLFKNPNLSPVMYGLVLLPLLASILGFIDDRREMSPLVKMGGQIFIGVLACILVNPINYIPTDLFNNGSFLVNHAWQAYVAYGLTIIWVVGFLNAFNFMDGLNGMAGLNAMLCIIFLLFMPQVSYYIQTDLLVPLFMAFFLFALMGFLIPNVFGKIFLGDAGSHGIACFIACLALLLGSADMGYDDRSNIPLLNFYIIPTLFAPFILDVVFTFLNRLRKRKNVFAGHNEHLYQRIQQSGQPHIFVAFQYGLVMAMIYFFFLRQIEWSNAGFRILLPYLVTFVIGAIYAYSLPKPSKDPTPEQTELAL